MASQKSQQNFGSLGGLGSVILNLATIIFCLFVCQYIVCFLFIRRAGKVGGFSAFTGSWY